MSIDNRPADAASWLSVPRPILVGFDGSARSIRAAAYACDLAHREQYRLIVVDLWDDNILDGLFPVTLPDRTELLAALNADVHDQLADLVAGRDIRWEVRHASGDPFVEFAKAATRTSPELVIVGGLPPRRWRLRRSLAARISRSNRWPVVTVG
jgi:nucleotide-binding universal stress UspA family protein